MAELDEMRGKKKRRKERKERWKQREVEERQDGIEEMWMRG